MKLAFTTPTGKRARSSSDDAKLVLDTGASDLPLHGDKHPYLPITLDDGTEARLSLGRCNLYIPGANDGTVKSATFDMDAGTVTVVRATAAAASHAAQRGPDATAGAEVIQGIADALIGAGDHLALRDLYVETFGWDSKRALTIAKRQVAAAQ